MDINDILRDFRRRYEESYLWVVPPDSNEESLFFVNRITEDKNNIANLELTSPEYGKIILNMGTAHTLRFKYPPVGVFQNGKDAYMFRRTPARQWKIGLYTGNCSIQPVWNSIQPLGGYWEFKDVLAAFDGEQYTFKDALGMLDTGKYRSVALRRNFSLVLSMTETGNYVLFYWETPIATFSPKGDLVHLHEKAYRSCIDQVKES